MGQKIIASPAVFDALRKYDLLKTSHWFDRATDRTVTVWGEDMDDMGNVRCELIDGEEISLVPATVGEG